MTTHKDPKEYCAECGTRYSFSDESCRNCGFNYTVDADDAEYQAKAEADFSVWQNSGRDHDPLA